MPLKFIHDLSEYFSPYEFVCKGKNCCGNSYPIAEKVLEALHILRVYIKKPIIINSGFRCRRYNKKIGGAKESFHTLGLAADIMVQEMDALELYNIVLNHSWFQNCGIGSYTGFVHIDFRGVKVTWTTVSCENYTLPSC
jgi:uncharacterized protein YcbK (DUF882 family)